MFFFHCDKKKTTEPAIQVLLVNHIVIRFINITNFIITIEQICYTGIINFDSGRKINNLIAENCATRIDETGLIIFSWDSSKFTNFRFLQWWVL
jgi:hypothetical protein